MDVQKKKCIKCGKQKSLVFFYANHRWEEEMFKDKWCKPCVKNLVRSEAVLKEYFKENRRIYPENYWDNMYVEAKEYVTKYKPFLHDDDRERAIINHTQGKIFQRMNLRGNYVFAGEENLIVEEALNNIDSKKDEKLIEYNQKWHGFFTDEDINYLEEYYHGLDTDFRLSNHSYRDYAKKVCKASLAMDKAFSDMQRNVIGAEKKYKQLKDIFDTLSQSAKFAEKTRSENDVVGFGSLGELINNLEENGFLSKPIKFNDDDVDLIVDDFRWIICSIGEKF